MKTKSDKHLYDMTQDEIDGYVAVIVDLKSKGIFSWRKRAMELTGLSYGQVDTLSKKYVGEGCEIALPQASKTEMRELVKNNLTRFFETLDEQGDLKEAMNALDRIVKLLGLSEVEEVHLKTEWSVKYDFELSKEFERRKTRMELDEFAEEMYDAEEDLDD